MDNAVPAFKTVNAARGWDWLVEGFALFKLNPGIWVALCLIWGLLAMLVSALPLGSFLVPLFTPVLLGGLMLGCADLQGGKELEIGHLFAGFQKQLVPLLTVGLALMLANIVIGLIVGVIAGVFGVGALLGGVAAGGMNSALGASALMAGLGLGLFVVIAVALVLYSVVFLAMTFAPILVALGGVQPVVALQASIKATLANWAPMAVYGLIAIGLSIVAMMPLGLGLLVLVPVMICGSYAAYRDVYADLPELITTEE